MMSLSKVGTRTKKRVKFCTFEKIGVPRLFTLFNETTSMEPYKRKWFLQACKRDYQH